MRTAGPRRPSAPRRVTVLIGMVVVNFGDLRSVDLLLPVFLRLKKEIGEEMKLSQRKTD